LHSAYTVKDLGLARYFLRIEISRSHTGAFFNQRTYILDILSDVGLTGAKPTKFPLQQGLHVSTITGPSFSNPELYKRLVGRLLYLTLTMPDISYAVQHLSQFLQQPTQAHYQAAPHVLRYLKGTTNKGLYYPANCDFHLTSYCDAD